MLTAIILGALLGADANAASHELSLELGSFGTSDDRFELFHERNLLGTYGLRAGLAVHPRVAVMLGYHYATAGNTVETDDSYGYYDYDYDYYDDEYYEDYYEEGNFQAAYRGHHLLLGPKVDIPIDDWGFPYLTVQGAMFVGQVLLDEDPSDDENVNELKATALNPGGVAAIGIDIVPLHLPSRKASFGGHIEMGYGLTAATGYTAKLPTGQSEAEIARFGLGGFYLRTGLGVYF